jgi:hypothetical protein
MATPPAQRRLRHAQRDRLYPGEADILAGFPGIATRPASLVGESVPYQFDQPI